MDILCPGLFPLSWTVGWVAWSDRVFSEDDLRTVAQPSSSKRRYGVDLQLCPVSLGSVCCFNDMTAWREMWLGCRNKARLLLVKSLCPVSWFFFFFFFYWEVSCLPLGRHDRGWLRRSPLVLVRCEFDVLCSAPAFWEKICVSGACWYANSSCVYF